MKKAQESAGGQAYAGSLKMCGSDLPGMLSALLYVFNTTQIHESFVLVSTGLLPESWNSRKESYAFSFAHTQFGAQWKVRVTPMASSVAIVNLASDVHGRRIFSVKLEYAPFSPTVVRCSTSKILLIDSESVLFDPLRKLVTFSLTA